MCRGGQERCTHASIKHSGGSVMAWDCDSASDVWDLLKIYGIMMQKNTVRF